VICTFYSYKGGVGRSMAMANVADILSRQGAKVLMVDFDLEAPGLEQFFHINHDGVRRHPGLLDLLLSYKQSMSVARSDDAAFRRLESFICPVYERLPGGGRLDIMPAGQRQDPEQLARYALSLRTFDWQDFYFDWEGGVFFEWLRRALVPERYDLVLVDSRTGVTEMGGICGYQLADAIVMLCSANHQNIDGTRNMVRDFRSTSVEALRHGRRLDLVIVPARIEQRDPKLLANFFARFEEEFSGLLPEALRQAAVDFRALTIPYEPQFAFEERIVSDPSRVAERQKIGEAFGLLANAVALLAKPAPRVAPAAAAPLPSPPPAAGPVASAPAPPPARIQYDATKRFADYDVFVDSSRLDWELVEPIQRGLKSRSLRVFLDREDIAPGSNWQTVIEDALFHSRLLLFCVGPGGLSELRLQTLSAALRARERGQNLTIVPVLLPGSDPTTLQGTPLAPIMALDLRGGVGEAELERLHHAVKEASSSAPHIEAESRAPFPGPRPFSEAEADLFCGREQTVARLQALAVERNVITIVGASGCGKTSLVNAGLIPALRKSAPRGTRWTVVSVRPGAEPLSNLIEALSGQLRTDEEHLAPGPDGPARGTLSEVLKATADRAAPGRLLVFVDQLEEIFTQPDPDARDAFTRALAEALRDVKGSSCIVLALRSSFLGSAIELTELWKCLSSTIFDVPLLSPDELRRAIEGPVERVGAAFEPGLVDRIVTEMRGEPMALPLLQALLFRLWQERRGGWLTNEAFAQVNGVGGVVTVQAEALYSRLADQERAALRWIMLRLVRPGRNGEDTRRRLPLEELMPAEAARNPEIAAPYQTAAKALVDAGLLISRDDDGRRVLEPAHESLVRGWPRLRDWLEAEGAFLAWRERLGAKVAEWQKAQRAEDLLLRGGALAEAETWLTERSADLNADERAFIEASGSARRAEVARGERRRKIGMGLLATAALTFLVLAVNSLVQMRAVDRERQLATTRLQIAEDTIAELRRTTESVQKLADSQASAASTAEEKRLQAERALRQLQASLATLQGRIDKSRIPESGMVQQNPPKN